MSPKFPAQRYALVNRPAGYATLPPGLGYQLEPRPPAGQPHHQFARHGILVPERALSDAEIRGFELVPLIDTEAEHEALAERVAEQLSRYASAYIESYEDDPTLFARGVMDRAERMPASVGDSARFVDTVVARLRARLPASPMEAPSYDDCAYR